MLKKTNKQKADIENHLPNCSGFICSKEGTPMLWHYFNFRAKCRRRGIISNKEGKQSLMKVYSHHFRYLLPPEAHLPGVMTLCAHPRGAAGQLGCWLLPLRAMCPLTKSFRLLCPGCPICTKGRAIPTARGCCPP